MFIVIFFEYAFDCPILCSYFSCCEAPFRASPEVAVVVVAQSIGGNVRFRDYRFIRKHPEDSRCLSCVHLERQVCRKMSARSTWCKTCITLHTCKVCEKLTHVVDKVPLCSNCTVKNVNNFAQWVCDACRTDGVPPLAYCKGCESLAVSSEGQLSEGDTRSLNLHYYFGVPRSCSSCLFWGVEPKVTWCTVVRHGVVVVSLLTSALSATSLCKSLMQCLCASNVPSMVGKTLRNGAVKTVAIKVLLRRVIVVSALPRLLNRLW